MSGGRAAARRPSRAGKCSRDTFSLSAGCYVISSTTHFESINVYSYTVLLPRPPGDGWKNFEENGRVDGSNWPLERVLIWAQKADNGPWRPQKYLKQITPKETPPCRKSIPNASSRYSR